MAHGCDNQGEADSSASQSNKRDDSVCPANLQVNIAQQRLVIDWKDGAQTVYQLGDLRRVCPCATCRTERENQSDNPLNILKTDPTGLRVVDAKLVGHYAIQFTWSDGHDTGIFDFPLLRSLSAD